MQRKPNGASTDDAQDLGPEITVTLTPAQAGLVAEQIAANFGARVEDLLRDCPTRESFDDAERLIAKCHAVLAPIAWGEPSGNVELAYPRAGLVELAEYFYEAGADRLARPRDYDSSDIAGVREMGRSQIATADAITAFESEAVTA